ncbi:MAG: hypothetical protein QW291_09275 [Thermofilaceae archaeon]
MEDREGRILYPKLWRFDCDGRMCGKLGAKVICCVCGGACFGGGVSGFF